LKIGCKHEPGIVSDSICGNEMLHFGGTMNKSTILLLAAIFLLFIGCDGENPNQDPSRYAFVAIPEYAPADYLALFADKDPEIVYDGLCYLHSRAKSTAETLSNEKVDKDSNEYHDASNIYNKVLDLLRSKDDRVLAAGLRFLQIFSSSYSKKENLLAPILSVRSNSSNVQLEQIIALSNIVTEMSPEYEPLLREALKSRSWLVSRAAYMLINKLAAENFRAELIRNYKASNREREQLLVLTALKDRCSNNTFAFLRDEFLAAKSSKIERAVHSILVNQSNRPRMLQWLDGDYQKLSEKNISLLRAAHKSISDLDIVEVIIRHGFVPDRAFVETLFKSIIQSQEQGDLSADKSAELKNMIHVKGQLLKQEAIKTMWASLEAKKEAEDKIKEAEEKPYADMLPVIRATFSKLKKELDERIKTHGLPDKNGKALEDALKELINMKPAELKQLLE
jgi:hypothetical protein